MNKFPFLLGILVWGLISCSKNNQGSPIIPVTDNIDTSKAAVKYRGAFTSAPGETVNGMALILIQNGTYTVALENLDAGNGPDLHLYLSKQLQPGTFIDLGKLKSTKGNQVYALSTVPDFTQYKYALIFCQQYNVLFGSAELK
ncbi:MAG: DM13 domain-containing protein [Chitinophagaceae bacterium]